MMVEKTYCGGRICHRMAKCAICNNTELVAVAGNVKNADSITTSRSIRIAMGYDLVDVDGDDDEATMAAFLLTR